MCSSVDNEYIELFCKNARFVRAYRCVCPQPCWAGEPGACSPRRRSPCDRYRSLAEEVAADTAQKGDLASEMWEHGEMNPLKWCARCCSNSSY